MSQGLSRRVRNISPTTEIRSPDRPARSESLYRLSYPGPLLPTTITNDTLHGLHLQMRHFKAPDVISGIYNSIAIKVDSRNSHRLVRYTTTINQEEDSMADE